MIDKNTLKEYPRPDWLPDWRDPRRYVDHGEDAASWAWEFLRRNPEYQIDYKHYMSVPWCYQEGRKTPKLAGRAYGDDDEMLYFHADPPAASPSETVGAYRRRTSIEPIRLEAYLLDRWGVSTLEDPAGEAQCYADRGIPPYQLETASYDSVFFSYFSESGLDRAKQHPQEWAGREVILNNWPEEDDGFMHVLAFDLRRPLPGQMKRAEMLLKEIVDELRASSAGEDVLWRSDEPLKVVNVTMPHKNKLLGYLRAFDAVWTVGMKRREIATALFPGGTSIETDRTALDAFDYAIGQAIELVNIGYRDLMRWADFPKNVNNSGKKTREPKD